MADDIRPNPGLADAEDAQRVWRSSRELGSGGSALASLGQGTVAILGGFDLTTAVLLTTSNRNGAEYQAALACFAISAAMFALALAFIASAEDYAATPDERRMYYSEAQVSPDALEIQRGLQWQDHILLSIYYNKRVLPTVTLAVLGTLAGLALVILARGLSSGSIVAAAAVVAVAVVYAFDWIKRSNWWLFPRPILPA